MLHPTSSAVSHDRRSSHTPHCYTAAVQHPGSAEEAACLWRAQHRRRPADRPPCGTDLKWGAILGQGAKAKRHACAGKSVRPNRHHRRRRDLVAAHLQRLVHRVHRWDELGSRRGAARRLPRPRLAQHHAGFQGQSHRPAQPRLDSLLPRRRRPLRTRAGRRRHHRRPAQSAYARLVWRFAPPRRR